MSNEYGEVKRINCKSEQNLNFLRKDVERNKFYFSKLLFENSFLISESILEFHQGKRSC